MLVKMLAKRGFDFVSLQNALSGEPFEDLISWFAPQGFDIA